MDQVISRITIDPEICNGKPTVRGKRIAVKTIIEFLAAGDSEKEVLRQFPSLEPEDIRAALAFAANMMDHPFTIKSVA